jgi:Skp family chaperone for outer membrane proteins
MRFLVVVLSVMAAHMGMAWAEAAAPLPAPIIAIVDVPRILQEAQAAQSVQKQLNAQRAKFQAQIAGEENGLRQAEQELAKERDKLDPQAYSDHEQKLRQRFSTVENHVQARRKVLDQSFNESTNAVHSALQMIVEKVAHEHHANLVIVKQQALWTDQPLDITDEVLKRFNQMVPQIKVTTPAEPPVPDGDHE